MKKTDLTTFNNQKKIEGKPFNLLINTPKKEVFINRQNIYSNDTLSSTKEIKKITKNRGRPIIVTDKRYKVCKPKKISPALESKLSILEDYISDFRETSGRITFEMIVNSLAEYYITHSLGVGKEEQIRKVISYEFENLTVDIDE